MAQRLTPMVSKVCASAAYLAENGKPEHPEQLAAHNYLLLEMPEFSGTWRFEASDGKRLDVAVKGSLRSSNAIALK